MLVRAYEVATVAAGEQQEELQEEGMVKQDRPASTLTMAITTLYTFPS
jgi:hypothetical protein